MGVVYLYRHGYRLGLAYAGSCRVDVMETILPVLDNEISSYEVGDISNLLTISQEITEWFTTDLVVTCVV